MPRANTPDLLSLERYAQLLGLDPLRFAGGYSTLRPRLSQCDEVWAQYQWQDPTKACREEVARCIAEAERDIADALSYWPAPVWIEDERHEYPRPYRRDLVGTGLNVRGRYKSLSLNWGHVIYGGQKATELLSDDPVSFTTMDTDGDGFLETAKFEIAGVSATLNVCQVRAYFKEYDAVDDENCRTDPASTGADPVWEVRPLRCTLSGTTLTVYCKVWQLFRPQLNEVMDWEAINADSATSFVDELLFYREYPDPETQVTFLWGEDGVCVDEACAWATQQGCLRVKMPRQAIVVPQPATWDDTNEQFDASSWAQNYEPNALRVWYRAGLLPERASVPACELLQQYWAETIMMLATSRLDWPICTCGNVLTLVDRWREDAAETTETRTFAISMADLDNPFGTRLGELQAWHRVKANGRRRGRAIIT